MFSNGALTSHSATILVGNPHEMGVSSSRANASKLPAGHSLDLRPVDGRPPGAADVLRARVPVVDQPDEDAVVVVHGELPCGAVPDEARVLADRDVGEAVPFPKRPAVEQRVTA